MGKRMPGDPWSIVGRQVGVSAVLMAVLVGSLAGCTKPIPDPAGPTTLHSTVTSTLPPDTPTTSTVTSTIQTTVSSVVTRTSVRTAAPPPPTKEPAARPVECPYLSTDEVSLINGQRAGQTELIDVKPQPICVFYRSDGGWMAAVRVIEAATPQQAIAAVNQHVPIVDSFPVNQPAGWEGGAMATPNGIAGNDQVRTVYAVSKGRLAIVAESNQDQSIKGRQLVIKTVAALKL